MLTLLSSSQVMRSYAISQVRNTITMQCTWVLTWVLKQIKGIGCLRLSTHSYTHSKFSVSLVMEVLKDADVSLTVNLTVNTSDKVSKERSVTTTNQQCNKRTRHFINKGKRYDVINSYFRVSRELDCNILPPCSY